MTLLQLVEDARASGDPRPLVRALPYAGFLGFELEPRGAELVGRLRFSEHLVGNSFLPALHGGAIGALLESTAILTVLLRAELARPSPAASVPPAAAAGDRTGGEQVVEPRREATLHIPKTISITVAYLRTGRPVETFAIAEVSRLGRRVATVRASAWQEDRTRPIAEATASFLLRPRGGP